MARAEHLLGIERRHGRTAPSTANRRCKTTYGDRCMKRFGIRPIAGRRIGDLKSLREQIRAWSNDVNKTQRGVDWQMKINDARSRSRGLGIGIGGFEQFGYQG